MMFIINGRYFIAERSRKGYRRFLWSMMPVVAPTSGEIRIEPKQVPRLIRRKAYRDLQKQGGEK
jgi:hypothetical protein